MRCQQCFSKKRENNVDNVKNPLRNEEGLYAPTPAQLLGSTGVGKNADVTGSKSPISLTAQERPMVAKFLFFVGEEFVEGGLAFLATARLFLLDADLGEEF